MKKMKWWHIIGLVFLLVGAVFLALCIGTDLHDDLYLPLALGAILLANALQLVMNIRENRKK